MVVSKQKIDDDKNAGTLACNFDHHADAAV